MTEAAARGGARPGASVATIAAVAIGGVAGSLARYGLGRAFPTGADAFPWTTLAVNVAGCLAIGVVMVLLTERRQGRAPWHPLWRPLLGPGLLGGFTTFSAYSLDLQRALADGRLGQGIAYGALTALGAVAAAAVGVTATRRLARPRGPGPA